MNADSGILNSDSGDPEHRFRNWCSRSAEYPLDEAGKNPDSGLGRFVLWVVGAALLTVFVGVLIFVGVEAFILYGWL